MLKQFFLLSLYFLFLITSCDNEGNGTVIEKPKSVSINKIMPLGASRVEGARPNFESFRYHLWTKLLDGSWEFDFIGTQSDLSSYPNHAGFSFDVDHEGRGGWTSGQILDGLPDWLVRTGNPDIVLFSSPAGNDALENLPYDQAIANIRTIIDTFQAANPNVTIIIEILAPARSDRMTPTLTDYFSKIKQDVSNIADEKTTNTSKVLPVDMASGFMDSFLADDVHYNDAGAAFVADQYYNVLVEVLEK